jgi:hypothetical protein
LRRIIGREWLEENFADDCNPSGLYKKPKDHIANAPQYQLYPNPTSGGFSFTSSNSAATGKWQTKITDITGKLLMDKEFTIVNGSIFVAIDFAPGVYLVNVYVSDDEIISKKLIIE